MRMIVSSYSIKILSDWKLDKELLHIISEYLT